MLLVTASGQLTMTNARPMSSGTECSWQCFEEVANDVTTIYLPSTAQTTVLYRFANSGNCTVAWSAWQTQSPDNSSERAQLHKLQHDLSLCLRDGAWRGHKILLHQADPVYSGHAPPPITLKPFAVLRVADAALERLYFSQSQGPCVHLHNLKLVLSVHTALSFVLRKHSCICRHAIIDQCSHVRSQYLCFGVYHPL